MALPAKNTPWPPATVHGDELPEYAAWYSGDPDQLQTFYQAAHREPTIRPAQLAGGVVGRVARWWWGQPTANGEQRAKLHVPLAADICGTSADLLFSEPLQLLAESESLQAAFADLQGGGIDAKFHEGAEVAAAMSGAYLRTVWDSDVSDLPWTEIAYPDGAVPVWQQGRLRSVTFWTVLPSEDASRVFRLLEEHEVGAISYGLYEGTGSNLGKQRPVESHPDTEWIATIPAGDGGILEGQTVVQLTGIDRLTVQYVPNIRPNRRHKSSPEGRSDLQGVTPLLDALDEAYSSWWRDIRHGKSRIHVPEQYMESMGPGKGAVANLDRELYVPVSGVLGSASDGLQLNAQQFKIRYEEHSKTCQDWTKAAVESAGYSTQSLTGDGGGAVTATEVYSHERRSYMTRGKKIRYWTPAVREHLRTLVDVANTWLGAGIEEADFTIEFADGVQDSQLSLAQTAQTLRTAEAASTETIVRMVNPDWDDARVQTEVSAIMSETTPAPVMDPTDLGF